MQLLNHLVNFEYSNYLPKEDKDTSEDIKETLTEKLRLQEADKKVKEIERFRRIRTNEKRQNKLEEKNRLANRHRNLKKTIVPEAIKKKRISVEEDNQISPLI